MPTSHSEMRPVRTRFAPSPTGFLHIGGARTALFAWAYARHHGGQFVLRIEDSDQRRHEPEAVQGIIDGMRWLGLQADEGPYHQSERMARYKEVVEQLLDSGHAYHCYCSPAELDALREGQRARGEKPRYDGRWRPERAQAAGLTVPAGVEPVVRFRNPDDGVVAWDDLVKGPISIANTELDDLVIARTDGSPTYNFCVVVDDSDRQITHVIRGDDHVNNTPRQINILSALQAPIPRYGHVPMIHGADGRKLSKRRDAVSVLHYQAQGYLPEAMVNYLARLGWSHGDDELFDVAQLIEWFDGQHLSQSASQFDTDKLNWVNHHYIQQADDQRLVQLLEPLLEARLSDPGITVDDSVRERLDRLALVALMKERAHTLVELADELLMFYHQPMPLNDSVRQALGKRATPESAAALAAFADSLEALAEDSSDSCDASDIAALVRQVVGAHGIKMPAFGVPLRALVFGTTQTPAIEQVLAVMPVDAVVARLRAGVPALGEVLAAREGS